jgi:hypothetical protein
MFENKALKTRRIRSHGCILRMEGKPKWKQKSMVESMKSAVLAGRSLDMDAPILTPVVAKIAQRRTR